MSIGRPPAAAGPAARGPVSRAEAALRDASERWSVFVAAPREVVLAPWHGPVAGADDEATAARAADVLAALEAAAAHSSGSEPEESAEAAEAVRRRQERQAKVRAALRAQAVDAHVGMALPEGLGSSWAAGLGVVPRVVAEPADLLDVLGSTERDLAVAEARRLAVVLALVGAAPCGSSTAEGQKVAEVAIATGLSQHAAATVIHRARMLAGPFDPFGRLLAAGEVSLGHCQALIGQTDTITDPEVLAAIAWAAAAHAGRVVSEFRRELDAIIAALDPDVIERRKQARAKRCVYTRPDKDGMAFLGFFHEASVVKRLYAQIVRDGATLLDGRLHDHAAAVDLAAAQADGRSPDPALDLESAARGSRLADGDLSPDACRADALAARVLGHRADDGTITWDPAANQVVTLEVVIDLDTLNELTDNLALVDGQPVPAHVGRDWARIATFVRRIVVDPVTGHLLDYGDRIHVPEPLRRHVLARDAGCREPGCTRRALRFLQLDHADEFPHGHSTTANTGALCGPSHRRKTHGLFDITDSSADGSATITTTWGQTVRIPPRRYLPLVPRPPAPPGPPEPLEPPPF